MGKRTPAAQARRNRQRGAEGERELCHLLSDALGFVVQRRLGQARDGGGDVALGTKWIVEIKRRKRIAGLPQWMIQAERAAASGGKYPIVAFRSDGNDWMMAFRLADAIMLLRENL